MSLFRREEAACRAELSEITGRSRWAPQPRSPHTGRSGPTRPAWSLSQCQGPSRKSAPKVHWSVTGLCQEEEEPVASPSDKPHSDWSSPPGLAALSWAQRPPVHGHWCRWQELDREWVSTEASRLLNSHRQERGDPEEWEQEPGRPQSHRLLPGSGHGAVTGWPGLGPAVAARSGGGVPIPAGSPLRAVGCCQPSLRLPRGPSPGLRGCFICLQPRGGAGQGLGSQRAAEVPRSRSPAGECQAPLLLWDKHVEPTA